MSAMKGTSGSKPGNERNDGLVVDDRGGGGMLKRRLRLEFDLNELF